MISYFSSPIAYIFIMMFLLLTGYLFWVILVDSHQASMRDTFSVIGSVLLFVTPMLTMRLFAEERKSGTMELLFTSPIKNRELVMGKFYAAFSLYGIMFLLTLSYPIILETLGDPDGWPIVSGYLGLFFMAGCYTSVGLFSSSLTENQIISGIICFGILLTFLIIDWGKTFFTHPLIVGIIKHLSFFEHYEAFRKGVISVPDIVYFSCFIFYFLFLTIRVLEIQRNQ